VQVDRSARAGVAEQSPLTMDLSTSVTAATKVGDEFEVTARLTNTADEAGETLSGIRAGSLVVDPPEIASLVSGPRTTTGADPRVSPLTLQPGESTVLTWTYRADGQGVAELRAAALGRDRLGELVAAEAVATVAIEAPGLELIDLRLAPGSPAPGQFANLRGTVRNVGNLDVTGVDVTVTANPKVQVVQRLLDELDPSVSPRIPSVGPWRGAGVHPARAPVHRDRGPGHHDVPPDHGRHSRRRW
jgi:hypothetical protein